MWQKCGLQKQSVLGHCYNIVGVHLLTINSTFILAKYTYVGVGKIIIDMLNTVNM